LSKILAPKMWGDRRTDAPAIKKGKRFRVRI